MSPEREIRPTVNGTDEVLAGSSVTPSVPPADAEPSKPVALIGSTVESRLAVELERLIADELSLDDFTPALQGYVLHGHRLALASLLPEYTRLETALAQANADAGRYYSALFNPREAIKVGPSRAELEKIRHATYYGGTE